MKSNWGFVKQLLFVVVLATIIIGFSVVAGAGAANPHHKQPAVGPDGRPLHPMVGTPTHTDLSGRAPDNSVLANLPPLAPDIKDTDALLPSPDTPEMLKGAATPQDVLLYAHLLRRAGFGPTAKDLKKAPKGGAAGRLSWINKQLVPSGIDDSGLKLPKIDPNNYDYDYIRTWYVRMAFSHRQLQEKMTLTWHEHFSVSDAKVGTPLFMSQHEGLMRTNSLGNFQTMLTAMVKDNAMLRWLDNDYNDGNDFSCGPSHNQQCPPNENFAREFMQLFTMGTQLLNIDGSLYTGQLVAPYNENDVKMLARAFSGWHIDYSCKGYPACSPTGLPDDNNHDFYAGKVMFGSGETTAIVIPARTKGTSGQATVADTAYVIDQMLNGDAVRKNSIAAFISKCLLQKIATENPSPQYIQAVATAFRDSGWSIKEAVKAILTAVDSNTGQPYFESPANVRTMYKDPIEQYVGAVRALWGATDGGDLDNWSFKSAQEVWYPPSVFSFYPPGGKSTLVNSAFVFARDASSNEFIRNNPAFGDQTFFKTATLIKKGKLTTATSQGVIDYLALNLVGAPGPLSAPGTFLHPETNTQILNYITATPAGTLDQHIQGIIYLILVSPDFQRN